MAEDVKITKLKKTFADAQAEIAQVRAQLQEAANNKSQESLNRLIGLEDRQKLQQEAVDAMDDEWEKEVDAQNKAKAGIDDGD